MQPKTYYKLKQMEQIPFAWSNRELVRGMMFTNEGGKVSNLPSEFRLVPLHLHQFNAFCCPHGSRGPPNVEGLRVDVCDLG